MTAEPQSPIRLLLVEDNPAHADMTAEWLGDVPGHAFEVVVVPTLEEALRSTGEDPEFDAVLLDLNLPDSHGIDTVRRLRAAHGDLPVVVVSSLVDEELRREAIAHGAQDVVDKEHTSSMILPRSILYAAELGRARSRQEQIQSLVSSAPEAMVVVDRDGKVNFTNAAASQLAGGESLLGDHVSLASETAEGEVEMRGEHVAFRGETRLVDIEWEGAPARLIVIRDLTDHQARLDAEAEAHEAKHALDLFKQVVEEMPVGVRLMAREGEHFSLSWQNAAATAAWELPNTPSEATVASACRAAVHTREVLILPDMRDDETKPPTIFALQVAPITDDLVGLFCEEVTERISLAEQLRQAQKMEAIGRLAGGIAHDFNNLLTVIISFAGLVRDSLDETSTEVSDLDEVLGAADRAAMLTKQLLAVSRRQPIAPKVVDVNELVIDVSRILRRTLGEDIELVVVPDSGIWPVYIDVGHFEQVMMNLAINARDAMPGGGKIFIETENVADPDHDLGEHVLVRVADTGIGMPDDVAAHIFEPFFTTKEQGKGTGLGLAMAYGMVRQADGTIDVHSEVGEGTRFEIRLPRTSLTYRPPRELAPSARQLRGEETVLVVEDEPRVRDAVRRFLMRHGYTVLEASNGEEGLRVFRQHARHVDLVVTDVVMPQMNGREFVEQLNAEFDGFRVLFMTGYTSDAVPKEQPGTELGAYYWLEKPFTEERLLMRVRRVLDDTAD